MDRKNEIMLEKIGAGNTPISGERDRARNGAGKDGNSRAESGCGASHVPDFCLKKCMQYIVCGKKNSCHMLR